MGCRSFSCLGGCDVMGCENNICSSPLNNNDRIGGDDGASFCTCVRRRRRRLETRCGRRTSWQRGQSIGGASTSTIAATAASRPALAILEPPLPRVINPPISPLDFSLIIPCLDRPTPQTEDTTTPLVDTTSSFALARFITKSPLQEASFSPKQCTDTEVIRVESRNLGRLQARRGNVLPRRTKKTRRRGAGGGRCRAAALPRCARVRAHAHTHTESPRGGEPLTPSPR